MLGYPLCTVHHCESQKWRNFLSTSVFISHTHTPCRAVVCILVRTGWSNGVVKFLFEVVRYDEIECGLAKTLSPYLINYVLIILGWSKFLGWSWPPWPPRLLRPLISTFSAHVTWVYTCLLMYSPDQQYCSGKIKLISTNSRSSRSS